MSNDKPDLIFGAVFSLHKFKQKTSLYVLKKEREKMNIQNTVFNCWFDSWFVWNTR